MQYARGMRVAPACAVALALLVFPPASFAAGISLDLEPEDSGNPDYLEIDVLGNLTEAEAEEGACVWLHTDGKAKVHGRTNAPSDPDRSEPPRGLEAGGWWYEVTCTDVAGNSFLDGAAAASYTGKDSHDAEIRVYFLREADDALLDTASETWKFIGHRQRNRTHIFGVPQPRRAAQGAPKLGIRIEAASYDGGQSGFVGDLRQDRNFLGARLSVDGRLSLAKGSGKRRAVTSGKGFGVVRYRFKGGRQYGARFRLLGGGRYWDEKVGAYDSHWTGPMVQAVQVRLVNSTIPGCPKGRIGFLHAAHARIDQAYLDLCAERSLWASLDHVKVKLTERR